MAGSHNDATAILTAELKGRVETVEMPDFLLFLLSYIMPKTEDKSTTERESPTETPKIDVDKLQTTFGAMMKEAVEFCTSKGATWKYTLNQ